MLTPQAAARYAAAKRRRDMLRASAERDMFASGERERDNMSEFERVSVVIPSYDPDEKLGETVGELIAAGFDDVIVVDDGSREDTKKYFPAEDEHVTVLRHEVNRGKGAALKTAFRYILDNRPDALGCVTADSDGQHRTDDIIACVRDMLANPDSIVLGARDFTLDTVPARSKVGNRFTSRTFRILFGMKLADTQTGLRVFPRSTLADMLTARGDRYEYETNMLIVMKRRRIPFREVTIETVYIDDNAASHFRPIRDSLRVYGMIVAFAFSSLVSWLIDFGLFALFRKVVLPMFLPATVTLFGVSIPILFAAAYAMARVVAATVNYTINRKVVFGDGDRSSVGRYVVLSVTQLALSALIGQEIVWLLHPSRVWIEYLIKMLVDTVLFFLSFRVQNNWVFRAKKPKMPKN